MRNVVWGVYLVIASAAAISLAIGVHETAAEWESWLAVITALLAGGAFSSQLRLPKRYRVLGAGTGWLFLVSSLGLAIVHGWGGLVQAAYALASLTFVVVVVVIVRINRRLRRALGMGDDNTVLTIPDDVRSQLATRAPVEDDHSLVIYPDRVKVAKLALIQVALLVTFSAGMYVGIRDQGWTSSNVLAFGACIVLDLTIVWVLTGSIWRLLRPRPALILNTYGIVDNATLWRTGVGLILWEEVRGVFCMGQGPSGSFVSRRRLVIVVANPAAFQRRKGPITRLLLGSLMLSFVSPVSIPEQLLPMTVEDLESEIERFARKVHPEWAADETEDGAVQEDAAKSQQHAKG